jgi:peptide/nickel transport system ATP-binding protein
MREKAEVQSRVSTGSQAAPPLLRVEALKLYFRTTQGVVQAVDTISFVLERNQALAILGESGCGKTSLARAILRLLPRNVHTYSGRVELDGVDVMPWSEERFRREVRWTKISMVAQAAMNSLNPVLRVGDQIAEPLMIHQGMDKQSAWARARQAIQLVGVPPDFLNRYPFELSGGMRQRAVIAMALVTNPDLIILDEPTSALDVLTQANIMNVLKQIKKDLHKSYILITHDIATSSELADLVAIMYAGQIVEWGTAEQFYPNPLHPYSQKLMASVPRLREERALDFIPGRPPSLINPPKGCRFAERCPSRFSQCEQEPPMIEVQERRFVKCWLYR